LYLRARASAGAVAGAGAGAGAVCSRINCGASTAVHGLQLAVDQAAVRATTAAYLG
jgi:hypothetical protein